MNEQASAERTDEMLFDRMRLGDRDALGALYDRYSRLLYGLILRIVRDRSQAEEVLQEVFLTVWSGVHSYDAASGPREAWLVQLARKRGLDRLRLIPGTSRPLDDLVDSLPEAPGGPGMLGQKREVMRRGLARLTAEQRILIEHAYFLGMTQSQLAEHFKLPLDTVKGRIQAGMQALREQLADL